MSNTRWKVFGNKDKLRHNPYCSHCQYYESITYFRKDRLLLSYFILRLLSKSRNGYLRKPYEKEYPQGLTRHHVSHDVVYRKV